MKYLLLIYSAPQTWSALTPEERARVVREHSALERELTESGEYIGGSALADPEQSKAVRFRDGSPVVTDGPYLEAKEHLAGYDMIDCESMERAMEIVARNPHIRLGGVEVRPLIDPCGLEM
ncbi:hypothetical protein BOX37_14235 [Nocardia mangyaensis]|uniref:YCII-related domain-containing protein n=1 Tax=Nocardia mangyaensis TaxID=2213200 RepID=A0A1J0VSC5_9NOCA|nr:YciI family protein [Nocardia mangyaensis]APE34914.1 hypothetical protein BOX37_14235 [Nocardia mangyaensis]